MKTLPFDVARCTGRWQIPDEFAELCLERKTCKRFLAFEQMFDEQVVVPTQVSITAGSADCQIKIEAVEVTE